jgi:two-component system OmpR family response regulator
MNDSRPGVNFAIQEDRSVRILVVEDDALVAEGLKEGLGHAGYTADHVGTAEFALEALHREAFDLAIIDLGLPKMDGLDLIRRLRGDGNPLPVLILTASDALQDCVAGLDAGADDYMVKPFRLPELLARARALVRRNNSITSAAMQWGPLVLDTARREANLGGSPLELPAREWTLLETLMLKAPNVVSKDRLTQSLGGWETGLTPNAVEVYVSRLRTKLEPAGVHIRTVRGIGYRLDEPSPCPQL